jgi:hypothetical protein
MVSVEQSEYKLKILYNPKWVHYLDPDYLRFVFFSMHTSKTNESPVTV